MDEELKEEKNPERVATILYKRPVLSKSVSKTKNKNKKVVQKSPQNVEKKTSSRKKKNYGGKNWRRLLSNFKGRK